MKIKVIEINAKSGEQKVIEREQTSDELKRVKEEVKESRITELKSKLASTDYKAIKFAEGALTEEEYAEIKTQRQSWRDEINRLEK